MRSLFEKQSFGNVVPLLLGLILALLSAACAGVREHEVAWCHPDGKADGGVEAAFDFQNRTPLEFLEMLKTVNRCSFFGVHQGWVQERDLPGLVALIDSNVPCAPVSRVTSSFYDAGGSTIGAEAYFLIMGFRKGEYPPGLNSPGSRYSEEMKREALAWWERYPGAK